MTMLKCAICVHKICIMCVSELCKRALRGSALWGKIWCKWMVKRRHNELAMYLKEKCWFEWRNMAISTGSFLVHISFSFALSLSFSL